MRLSRRDVLKLSAVLPFWGTAQARRGQPPHNQLAHFGS